MDKQSGFILFYAWYLEVPSWEQGLEVGSSLGAAPPRCGSQWDHDESPAAKQVQGPGWFSVACTLIRSYLNYVLAKWAVHVAGTSPWVLP